MANVTWFKSIMHIQPSTYGLFVWSRFNIEIPVAGYYMVWAVHYYTYYMKLNK